jgi:hypothetical protein
MKWEDGKIAVNAFPIAALSRDDGDRGDFWLPFASC